MRGDGSGEGMDKSRKYPSFACALLLQRENIKNK